MPLGVQAAVTVQPWWRSRRVRSMRSATAPGEPTASTEWVHSPARRRRCSHPRRPVRPATASRPANGTTPNTQVRTWSTCAASPASPSTPAAAAKPRTSLRYSPPPLPSTVGSQAPDRYVAKSVVTATSSPLAAANAGSVLRATSRPPAVPASATVVASEATVQRV